MSGGRQRSGPQRRLAGELQLERWSDAPNRCALVYPSGYHVGMSSLGFQQIWRSILATDGWTPLRAFNDDDEPSERPFAYELNRAMPEVEAIALSVAYELELAGVITMLERFGLPPLRRERQPDHPIVIAGGPLTFSNPAPLLPFVDVLICGEGEGLIKEVLQRIEGEDKASLSALLSELPGVVVATERAPVLLPVAKADDVLLPAHSAIVAESTELRKMFLIEPERGCSRQCTYCVMRRSTNGGCARCRRKRYSTPSRKALSELDWSALRSPTTERSRIWLTRWLIATSPSGSQACAPTGSSARCSRRSFAAATAR